MTRNYIKFISASNLNFPKHELNIPLSNHRKKVYSFPLFIYSSLFLSHDIRRDINVFLILSDNNNQVIKISSNRLRNMRPDFRSILFVLDKAMKMALKRRANNGFSQWAGIRIFKSLEEMRDTLKRYSLVIVVHGRQDPHLTSLPREPDRYLIQIGVPSSVIIRLESFFPLLGKLSFPPSFDLCFAPSVLNIEFDRGQIFDRRFNPATV